MNRRKFFGLLAGGVAGGIIGAKAVTERKYDIEWRAYADSLPLPSMHNDDDVIHCEWLEYCDGSGDRDAFIHAVSEAKVQHWAIGDYLTKDRFVWRKATNYDQVIGIYIGGDKVEILSPNAEYNV